MKRIQQFLWTASVALVVVLTVGGSALGKDIKIGAIGPMKFTMGEHIRYGSNLAVEEINAAGGVKVGGSTQKMEVIEIDSNSLASVVDSVSAMEKLITVDKVDFIVGGARSEAVIAQMEVMADYKKIYMTPPVSPVQSMMVAKNYDRYKYWFRSLLNSEYYGKVAIILAGSVASKIREELKINRPRVALLFEKILAWDNVVPLAQDLLPKMGMDVVGVWRPSAAATDVTAELTAIRASGAHIILQIFATGGGVTVSRQWGELRIPAVLVGPNLPGQQKRHWKDVDGLCNYVVLHSWFAPAAITEKAIPFWNKMDKRFNDYPQATTSVYDAIYVLKEAIERAGTLTSDSVVAELEKTDYRGAMGRFTYTGRDSKLPHELQWGPKHISAFGLQWRDEKLVTVWPDGRPLHPAVSNDPGWKGLRHAGTTDIVLPPWMVKYWKEK